MTMTMTMTLTMIDGWQTVDLSLGSSHRQGGVSVGRVRVLDERVARRVVHHHRERELRLHTGAHEGKLRDNPGDLGADLSHADVAKDEGGGVAVKPGAQFKPRVQIRK